MTVGPAAAPTVPYRTPLRRSRDGRRSCRASAATQAPPLGKCPVLTMFYCRALLAACGARSMAVPARRKGEPQGTCCCKGGRGGRGGRGGTLAVERPARLARPECRVPLPPSPVARDLRSSSVASVDLLQVVGSSDTNMQDRAQHREDHHALSDAGAQRAGRTNPRKAIAHRAQPVTLRRSSAAAPRCLRWHWLAHRGAVLRLSVLARPLRLNGTLAHSDAAGGPQRSP